MASSAADKSPPSRSHFQKSVTLQDWWLTKPQTDDDRKTIGVSGLTCTSQLNRAERCFSSAPIVKVYDFFELETVDGVCVILQGYINKEKTLGSGFSSEVFDHFVIGFPSYWEEFSTSCPQRGSSDECILREHEEGKDSIGKCHDTNTGVEDCQDKVLSNKASSISHEEPITNGDEVLFERFPLTSEFEDTNIVGNIPSLECLGGVCSKRMTRSMTKMDDSKNHGVTFFDPENLNIAKKDKYDDQYAVVEEPEINKMRSNLDPLTITTRSMKSRQNKNGGKEGAAAKQGIAPITSCKRKLTFESRRCEMAKRQNISRRKSTSTPTASKGPTERYVSVNVLSPESFSSKRSRSGRVLLPSLEFWRNQTVVYDVGLDRQVTGVRDAAQSSKVDTSENSKAIRKKDRKARPRRR